MKTVGNLLSSRNISAARNAALGIRNATVASENKQNTPLDVYNADRHLAFDYRKDMYGDITPYVNAAQTAQAKADAFNAAEAEKNRQWQAEMSSTAHQREVADLKAAGLNPIISAYGQGAATGSGATASSSNALTGVLGNMAMSAMQAVGTMSQTMLNNSTSRLNAWQTNETAKQTTQMNNETQLVITRMNNLTSKECAEIAGRYGLSSAQVSAMASQYAAQIAANASMANAETAANASRYASNVSYLMNKDTNTVNEAMNTYKVDWSTASGVLTSLANIAGTVLGSGMKARPGKKG